MKAINKHAFKVLAALVAAAEKNGNHTKIDNNSRESGLMPVHVEILQAEGDRLLVSVAHYYEQNGDLMADPEMLFLFCKDVQDAFPTYYRMDAMGREQLSVKLDGLKATGYYPRMQRDHATFAGQWMRNIKLQQGL